MVRNYDKELDEFLAQADKSLSPELRSAISIANSVPPFPQSENNMVTVKSYGGTNANIE